MGPVRKKYPRALVVRTTGALWHVYVVHEPFQARIRDTAMDHVGHCAPGCCSLHRDHALGRAARIIQVERRVPSER